MIFWGDLHLDQKIRWPLQVVFFANAIVSAHIIFGEHVFQIALRNYFDQRSLGEKFTK